MKLTIVGCGDAFGSGGRMNTCFHVASEGSTFLIDCGATTLVGLKRLGLKVETIDTIFISHLHGDHFGGLPFFLIDSLYCTKRTIPLTIVGPIGTEARLKAANDALFPGAVPDELPFALTFLELEEREPIEGPGVTVTPYEVRHPCGATPFALRFDIEGKIVAFSGDTEWVEGLVDACKGADLMITECFHFTGTHAFHLSLENIMESLPRIAPKKVLLTHMSKDTLARAHTINDPRLLVAFDGMTMKL